MSVQVLSLFSNWSVCFFTLVLCSLHSDFTGPISPQVQTTALALPHGQLCKRLPSPPRKEKQEIWDISPSTLFHLSSLCIIGGKSCHGPQENKFNPSSARPIVQSASFCRVSDPFSFPSGKWGCWTRRIWHPHPDSFLSLSLGLAHHWHTYKAGSHCFGHLLHSPFSRLTTGIFRWHLHSPTQLGSVRGGWIHPQLPLSPPPGPVTSSKLIRVPSSPWRFCLLSWSKQLKPRNFVCWLKTKIPSSPGNVKREHTIPKLAQAHTFDDITTIKY